MSLSLYTDGGMQYFCLPDCARCRLTGENPETMDKCPAYNFDDHGDVCVPELCNEYEEEAI